MELVITRIVLGVLLLGLAGCSTSAQELESRFEPLYMEPPEYPPELYSNAVQGSVTVLFDVEADGRVSQVRVLESAHPKFSEVVRERVLLWRFKPWTPTVDHPAPLEVKQVLKFQLAQDFVLGLSQEVLQLSCSDINREYSAFRKATPSQPLEHMGSFEKTGGTLAFMFAEQGKNDTKSIEFLNKLFLSALPRVVERCQQASETIYADVLFEEMGQVQVPQ